MADSNSIWEWLLTQRHQNFAVRWVFREENFQVIYSSSSSCASNRRTYHPSGVKWVLPSSAYQWAVLVICTHSRSRPARSHHFACTPCCALLRICLQKQVTFISVSFWITLISPRARLIRYICSFSRVKHHFLIYKVSCATMLWHALRAACLHYEYAFSLRRKSGVGLILF